ncbi:hypothetical protein D7X74_42230, partial [Corallococcus sp. CA047B]
MNRKVAVCVGVMVAVAGGVAGAEEPAKVAASVESANVVTAPSDTVAATSAAPVVMVRTQGASSAAPVADPRPSTEMPSGTEPSSATVAAPTTVPSAAPLVEAATGGAPAQAAVAQRSESGEIHVPAVLMLMPHVSTVGTDTGRLVTTFAVGLLGTQAKRVDGLAMSLGANWVGQELSGGQLAVGANV